MGMVDVHGDRAWSRLRRNKKPGIGNIFPIASCCTGGSTDEWTSDVIALVWFGDNTTRNKLHRANQKILNSKPKR